MTSRALRLIAASGNPVMFLCELLGLRMFGFLLTRDPDRKNSDVPASPERK